MKLKFRETQEEILPLLDGINRYEAQISNDQHFRLKVFDHVRFNPANIQNLESYLELQCEENEYDLEANLTLLKL